VDGNRETDGDPTWTPLQFTYPMPDHDSGHGVQGGVAAEIKQVFGTDAIAFTACRPVGGTGSEYLPVCRSPTRIAATSSLLQAARAAGQRSMTRIRGLRSPSISFCHQAFRASTM
jgi:hypothetical protein